MDITLDVFEELKEIIETKQYTDEKVLSFLDEDDLFDDDYKRSEISAMQTEFMRLVEAYLKESHPGRFIMYHNWAVHICTVGFRDRYLEDFKNYKTC